METQVEILKAAIYNELHNNASKKHPIQAKKLCTEYQIKFRALKEVITELRKEYPIVAKETDGGGYWIAESWEDIWDYIKMIERRKQGYDNTIQQMKKFLM